MGIDPGRDQRPGGSLVLDRADVLAASASRGGKGVAPTSGVGEQPGATRAVVSPSPFAGLSVVAQTALSGSCGVSGPALSAAPQTQ